MNSRSILAGLLVLIAPSRPARGDSPGIALQVAPGPIFVGQGIAVRVEVTGDGGGAEILPPDSPVATIQRVNSGSRGAGEAGGSGSSVSFVLIPRRAGTVDVPPFRVRSGDRTVASRPVRLVVASLPAAGRTSAFLGGVGRFDLKGEVDRATIRAGQTVEFRLRVTGEASWGMTQGPDLAAWAKPLGFRVEALEDVGSDPERPSKTFRYRLRPGRAGKATLPPLAIAAFDPVGRRYLTKTSASIPIEVEQPARFDPGSLDYGESAPAGPPLGPRLAWLTPAATVASLIALTGVALWRLSRSRARRRAALGRFVETLASGLDPASGELALAEQITTGLAEILLRLDGRPMGVLTPPEARRGLARWTGDDSIGDRAGRLVGTCDRVRYGGDLVGPAMLVADAREVLEEIAGSLRVRAGGRAEGGSRDRIV